MTADEKELWLELYDLERQGVFGDGVIALTKYIPNAPKRCKEYTKILYEREGAVYHCHVRRTEEKWAWERWERTKRYRALRRRLERTYNKTGQNYQKF